jgi:hypothetical protein
MDPLELRQLKIPLNGRSLGAKGSAVKRVGEVVTQEYAARFVIQASGATSPHTVFGRLHEESQVDRYLNSIDWHRR